MAREVTWTDTASDDLDEVAGYIAKDSEFYAATVGRELISAARSLTILSERGRVDSFIYVLRIIHGARMLPPRIPNG